MRLPLSIRASSTDRRFTCHGSLLAEPRVPAHHDDESSSEGTLLHYLIAMRAITELGATPPDGGLPAPKMPPGFKLNPFSAWIVDWGFRFIQDTIPADWSLLVEAEFAYEYELPRPIWVPVSEIIGPIPYDTVILEGMVLISRVILSGHIDILGLSPDGTECIGIDWKTGNVGADPAEENWQMATYLGLVRRAWEELCKGSFILAQPRIDEEATGIPRVSRVDMDGAKLDAMNRELAEQVNKTLENRYTTDSSPKACRYCNVALHSPWLCPSLRKEMEFMKGTIEAQDLNAMQAAPDFGKLGDFVMSGRTLTAPIKAATEALNDRIDAVGYVDAANGTRITVKVTNGDITIADPTAFREKVEQIIPERERQDRCVTWAKGKLINEIADANGLSKTSTKGGSATEVWDTQLQPLVQQGKRRTLIFT